MLKTDDKRAIGLVREYLDDLGYGYLSHRAISQNESAVWPPFAELHQELKRLHPRYHILFSLLRQGFAVQPKNVRDVMPQDVIDAMFGCGLLIENRHHEWQTPGLAVVAVMGLYLVVSLPPHFPTAASAKQPVYIGMESLWLARALPSRVTGTALDICAGSGVQGLLCAQRGAQRVVALELDPLAASCARFNAILNGLDDRFEVRTSDLYGALEPDERFDLIVSNPPFMPVMEGVDYPICGTGGPDGMTLLREIFAGLSARLTDTGRFIMFCNVLGSRTAIAFNQELLRPTAERDGLQVRAFVTDKHTIAEYVHYTLEPNLIHSCPELGAARRTAEIQRWQAALAEHPSELTHIYGQVLDGRRQSTAHGVVELTDYNPLLTDPLVHALRLVQRAS